MTPDEARAVLVSARETAEFQSWQDLHDLIHPVYEARVLTGTEQGEAAFLVGEASRGLGSWDAAVSFYEEAATTATPEIQATVQKRLAEAGRIDTAHNAEADGVVQDEAAAVLAAGDDAMRHDDLTGALEHYRAAYRGVVDGEPKYRAALGIARACAHLEELDEAASMAEYVAENADGDLATQGKELVEWIRVQRQASEAAADGVSAGEFKELVAAAKVAYQAGSYEQALELFLALSQSTELSGTDQAKMAYNVGMVHRVLGNEEEAKPFFEHASEHAPADAAASARAELAKIARHEAAEALVDALAD
jgi:tetratricopeptide (TPR) repeat protein